MHYFFPTKDIKLFSILIGLGIPYRKSDPVTREVQEKNGRPFDQYTFWLDIADESKRGWCKVYVDAYYKFVETWETTPIFPYVEKDEGHPLYIGNHPLYFGVGFLFNRETTLHWMRTEAEPMKLIKDGNRTVMMSARASQVTKDKIKSQL